MSKRREFSLPHALIAAIAIHAAMLMVGRFSRGAPIDDVSESVDRPCTRSTIVASAGFNADEEPVIEPHAAERLVGEPIDGSGAADGAQPWPSAGGWRRSGRGLPDWLDRAESWASAAFGRSDHYFHELHGGVPEHALLARRESFITPRHGPGSTLEPRFLRLRGRDDYATVGPTAPVEGGTGHAVIRAIGHGIGVKNHWGSGFSTAEDLMGSKLAAPPFHATLTLRWTAGVVAIDESLEPALLQRSVVASLPKMKSCVVRAPDLDRAMRVRLAIEGDHVGATSFDADPIGVCVIDVLRRVEIPR